MEVENRLIPILMEGVGVVQMVLFKKLRDHLAQAYPQWPPADTGRLTGAVVNALFDSPNTEEPFASFARDHAGLIEEELGRLADRFDDLRIPLTDALRVQFLCDDQHGIDRTAMLERAKRYGVLMEERPVPLPRTFLEMIRRIGKAYQIVTPPIIDLPEEENEAGSPDA